MELMEVTTGIERVKVTTYALDEYMTKAQGPFAAWLEYASLKLGPLSNAALRPGTDTLGFKDALISALWNLGHRASWHGGDYVFHLVPTAKIDNKHMELVENKRCQLVLDGMIRYGDGSKMIGGLAINITYDKGHWKYDISMNT